MATKTAYAQSVQTIVEKPARKVNVMARIRPFWAIWLAFALNSEPALAGEVPREATKSISGVAEPKTESATEEELIVRFERMVKKYQQFFSEPRLCYIKQKSSTTPNGVIYNSAKFMAVGNESFDIKKTDSLISPYTGYILMILKKWTAKKCGNVQVTYRYTGTKIYGFYTLEEAKQAAVNDSCFELDDIVPVEEVRFNFAFQRGKWVWKSVIRTKYNNDQIDISGALGDGSGVGYPLEDNKDWLVLLEE